jgi:two-component sensor histidine kinase/PAS domain-containing protein
VADDWKAVARNARAGGELSAEDHALNRASKDEQLYAEAVVRTVRQPLLVLSGDLVVETANPAFYRAFEVGPEETEGRPIYALGNGQWDIPRLRELLENVLLSDGHVEDFRVEHDFEGIGRRVMLLNAHRMERADRPDRILLSIDDITVRERIRFELEGQKEFAEKVVDASRDALLILGWDLRVRSANETFYTMFKVDPAATKGRLVYELGNGQWDIPRLRELLEKVLPGNDAFDDFVVEHDFEGIGHRVMVLNARKIDHLELILLAIEDVTERLCAERERELLVRELSHRVKNVFAVVQALATQTDGRMESVEAYREAFLGRLRAMARTHGMVLDADWRGTELGALVNHAVEAYRADRPQVVVIEGEPIPLTPAQSLGLSLVLHELGTNAAKFGALSNHEGHVRISWCKQEDQGKASVRLRWEERGGPQITPPTEKGFGSRLIEQASTLQLKGSVELDYATEGLTCCIVFPVT